MKGGECEEVLPVRFSLTSRPVGHASGERWRISRVPAVRRTARLRSWIWPAERGGGPSSSGRRRSHISDPSWRNAEPRSGPGVPSPTVNVASDAGLFVPPAAPRRRPGGLVASTKASWVTKVAAVRWQASAGMAGETARPRGRGRRPPRCRACRAARALGQDAQPGLVERGRQAARPNRPGVAGPAPVCRKQRVATAVQPRKAAQSSRHALTPPAPSRRHPARTAPSQERRDPRLGREVEGEGDAVASAQANALLERRCNRPASFPSPARSPRR